MVVFFAPQVRDVTTGQLLAGLVGQTVTIVYPGTTDPVEITEYPSDVPIPESVMSVSATFSLASFNTPSGVYAVEAVASNGTRAYLESSEGARLAAEGAQASAESAVSAAQAAQAAAEAAAASAGSGGGGVTAHAALSGLQSDDHPQYLNTTRGDARYYTKSQVDSIASSAATSASIEDRKRSNHTGTQPISTITNLEARLSALENGGGGSGVLVLTNDDPDPAWTGTPTAFFRYEVPNPEPVAVPTVAWVVTGTTGGTTTSTTVAANPADQVGGSVPDAGDIMVAVLQNDTNFTGDPTPPAGWTRFIPAGLPGITGTMGSRVYWKVRAGGETSYTFTLPEAKHCRLSIVGIRGAEPFSSWQVGSAKVRYEGAPESVTSTAPSITSSKPTALALAIAMERTANDETELVDATAGWTEEAFFPQVGSVLGTLAVYSKTFTGPGDTGTFVATYPNPQSNNGAGFQLLIGSGA